MEMIGHSDSLLTFGSVTLSAATSSGAVIGEVMDIGNGDIENMSVQIGVNGATGGTSLVFSIEGSADNSSYSEVGVTGTILLAKLGDGANIKIPRGFAYRYLRAKIKTVNGTFTAGTVKAQLDTYVGK